ncbi:MAG: TraX family protein [Porcipelethomonas sp.]
MAIDISNRPDRPSRRITLKSKSKPKPGISSDVLKLLAVIAMTIDHIAWIYVPFASFPGQLMHIIGRIAAPIMCFMIAEGYAHTRDPIRYAKRLGLFALISHFPYVFFESGRFALIHQTSIMLPLFLGLIALIIRDSPKYEAAVKNMILLIICLVSMLGDWGCIAVIWIQFFYAFRYNRREQMKYFCIITAVMLLVDIIINATYGCWYKDLFKLGIFLAVPFLMKCSGVRKTGNAARWFYYIYYPAHMIFLRAIYPLVLSLSVYIVHHVSSK